MDGKERMCFARTTKLVNELKKDRLRLGGMQEQARAGEKWVKRRAEMSRMKASFIIDLWQIV